MSLIGISAELIRRAVADDGYAQDLRDAVAANPEAHEGLVHAEITREELGWLAPSEWQWFAHWRRHMGGPLDKTILNHLSRAAVTRYARFELRGLVMRDQRTNELAQTRDGLGLIWFAGEAQRFPGSPETEFRETRYSLGLGWLAGEAQTFPDSMEVVRDALQYATEASWFTLRVLTSMNDERSEQVRTELRAFAAQRQLGEEIMQRWGM